MAPKPRKRSSMDAEAVARMMAAQDQDAIEAASDVVPPPSPAPQPPIKPEPTPESPPAPAPQPFDPGKVDGRTLRATGRVPFATRIKPEAHEALRRIAYHQGITIAEALERAVSTYDAIQAER